MNKHQPEAELKSYFREAGSWADDRRVQSARSSRMAWIVAGVATTIAALEAIALAGLMPLKTVVPHTVLVDRQTGHVTTLDPSKPVKLTPDDALAKSLLAQYVSARETLDRNTISGAYRKVALWSGETARSTYLASLNPGNPANPLARLPRQISVQARIKSVSLMDEGQALVRYDLIQRNGTGAETQPVPFVSVVRFRFRDRPLTESDRFINPLGFEVTRYRKDPEAPLSRAAPSPPALNSDSVAAATGQQEPITGDQP